MMHVTVAICTWNRANLLDRTLTRMHELHVSNEIEWELLVVNNNCTDHTDAVIADHAVSLPIRRVFEPKQGLSSARNGAIEAARGDLLLWTDDDVLVDPNWMNAYVRASAEYPDYDFFVGRVDPLFEIDPPEWVMKRWDSFKHVFALIDLGERVTPFPEGIFPAGANMAIRMATQRNHLFDTKLGRSKLDNISGDDNRLYVDLCNSGVRSLWVSDARVEHFIPKSRISKRYIGDWHEGAARTVVREGSIGFNTGVTWFGAPRWLFRQYVETLVRHLCMSILSNDRSIDIYIQSKKVKGTILELLNRR